MKAYVHLRHLTEFYVEWEMFQTKVVEKLKIHILCSVTFFFLENRAIYEKMWKNIVEPSRPQMTIWRMRIACWIPKATDTNSEYIILIDFLDMWDRNGSTSGLTPWHMYDDDDWFSAATLIARTRLIAAVNVQRLSCFVYLEYRVFSLLGLELSCRFLSYTPWRHIEG